jgi:nucleotide-binding universal stress UspA family protein
MMEVITANRESRTPSLLAARCWCLQSMFRAGKTDLGAWSRRYKSRNYFTTGNPTQTALTWIKALFGRGAQSSASAKEGKGSAMIRTILVPLATELSSEALLDTGLSVAKQLDGHIRALFIQPDPDAAFAYLPDVILAAGVTREVIEREALEAAAAAKDSFVAWRKRNDVPEDPGARLDSCFATWSEKFGDVEAIVARFGRVSDLIVVPSPSTRSVHGQRCFDAAVFESGRPTLVVGEKLPFDITDHVMIAWNGSLEASRAVLGAMPLLHQADRVSIFAVPQYEDENVDADDLAEALRWHGIRARQIPSPRNEASTGVVLVSAAIEQQATMIVMGAYTHSRLRQRFLGGVTKHLLAQAPVPLLMSH